MKQLTTELNFKIYKELIKLTIKEKKNPPATKKQPNQKMDGNLNGHFTKEDIQIANRHMKRCSTLLGLREVKISHNGIAPHPCHKGHHPKERK